MVGIIYFIHLVVPMNPHVKDESLFLIQGNVHSYFTIFDVLYVLLVIFKILVYMY